jgi:hypothetical protein
VEELLESLQFAVGVSEPVPKFLKFLSERFIRDISKAIH